MILDRSSAVLGLPWEIAMPLNANHLNISKFPSAEDRGYITVRNVLEQLINSVRESKCLFHHINPRVISSNLLNKLSSFAAN